VPALMNTENNPEAARVHPFQIIIRSGRAPFLISLGAEFTSWLTGFKRMKNDQGLNEIRIY